MRAEQDFERQKKLYEEKVISEAEWQLAQQTYKVAENELKSARQSVEAARYIVRSSEASVREARENVQLTNVVAPMTGIVSKLDVKKGERVVGTQTMAGTEMMRIADLNVMEVRVDVNENDIVRVHVGDTALIDVDAYSAQEKIFKGIVTLIANTANEKTTTDAITEFEVRILILKSSYQDLIDEGNTYPFRPGMTASVEILTTRKENVLAVPLASVTTRNPAEMGQQEDGDPQQVSNQSGSPMPRREDKVVLFVNDNGVARMMEVKTGISDYDNIEILSGISDTVEVVTGPFLVVSKRLKDGDRIRSATKSGQKK